MVATSSQPQLGPSTSTESSKGTGTRRSPRKLKQPDETDEVAKKNEDNHPTPAAEVADDSSEVEDVDESDGETESSSEESVELPPPLAPNRSRRLNAGNRMAKVLVEDEKAEGDEVYDTLYGGFKEVEDDANFEVDSDEGSDDENQELDEQSDEEEKEDDNEGPADEADEKEPKKKKKKKTMDKKPSWLVSQMSEQSVPLNALSEKDQADRLKQCQAIAQVNRESLAAMIKKQREEQEKRSVKPRARFLVGPKESFISNRDGTFLVKPHLKTWSAPEKAERKMCVVSGKPARYVDWRTGLPYFGVDEFNVIRRDPQAFSPIRQPKSSNEMTQVTNKKSVKFEVTRLEQPSTSSSYPNSWTLPKEVNEVEKKEMADNSSIVRTLLYTEDPTSPMPSPDEVRHFRARVLGEKPQPSPSENRPAILLKPVRLSLAKPPTVVRLVPLSQKRPQQVSSPHQSDQKRQKIG